MCVNKYMPKMFLNNRFRLLMVLEKVIKFFFCVDCEKYRKFLNSKIPHIFDKTLVLSIIYSECGNNNNRIFKEEESVEIMNMLV